MKRITGSLNQRRMRMSFAQVILVVTAAAIYALGSITQPGQSAISAQLAASGPARYRVKIDGSNTTYTGQAVKATIELLDQYGKKLYAPGNLPITITVTTLNNLDNAKSFIQKSNQQPLRLTANGKLTVTLPAGKPVIQVSTIFPIQMENKDITIIAQKPGRVIIYAESPGLAVGETVFITLDRSVQTRRGVISPPRKTKPLTMSVADQEAQWTPVAFRQPQVTRPELPKFSLVFSPPSPTVYCELGIKFAEYAIELWSQDFNSLFPSPADIRIRLRVQEGSGWFVPDVLTIPTGEAITPVKATLKSQFGGKIKILAEAVRNENFSVEAGSAETDIEPAVFAGNLVLTPSRRSTTANGLSEIEVRVEARRYGDDKRVVLAKEELMNERLISFRVEGGSGLKYDGGQSSLRINGDDEDGVIRIYGSSHGPITLIASSTNINGNRIEGRTEVYFTFPFLALFAAFLGGITLPAFLNFGTLKSSKWKTALPKLGWGALLGIVLFGLVYFNAISSDPQNIGTVKVYLGKLPTDNWFAAYLLGLLGYVILFFMTTLAPKPGSTRSGKKVTT